MKLRTMFAALIALACASLASEGAYAQNITAKVVTSCNTAQGITAGNAGAFTVDTNGNLCTGIGGSGATVSTNVTQLGGVSINLGAGATGTGTQRVTLASDSPGILALGQAVMASSAPVTIASNQSTITTILSSQYPSGAVPITASATGTTGATTATLAASASLKTYICGFSIRANATAAATANSTVTGTVTGTLNFTQWTAPLASGIGLNEQIFNPCIPSSAINTAVAVISAAPGSGGVVSSTAWGYQAL